MPDGIRLEDWQICTGKRRRVWEQESAAWLTIRQLPFSKQHRGDWSVCTQRPSDNFPGWNQGQHRVVLSGSMT
jgi:hypothetical protein